MLHLESFFCSVVNFMVAFFVKSCIVKKLV